MKWLQFRWKAAAIGFSITRSNLLFDNEKTLSPYPPPQSLWCVFEKSTLRQFILFGCSAYSKSARINGNNEAGLNKKLFYVATYNPRKIFLWHQNLFSYAYELMS